MNVSLYEAAAAMNANSLWQDVVADNLASNSVPGFKKQSLTTAAVQAGLMSVDAAGQPQYFNIPQSSVTVSFKNGEMQYSGTDKTAAIEGDGFFQVELPDGSTAVTRDGEFQVSAHGQLVTKEGYSVLGESGPIQVDPHNLNPMTISAAGEVRQGGEVKGKISLVDYKNPSLLTQTKGVYFLPTDPALQTKDATGTLRQGFVETANGTSLGEMTNMMSSMRSFEANQHVIQIQDDRLGKVISDLGNTSGS
jgi:flagellar basal body rod protein FlgG